MPTVLVVEDNPLNLKLVRDILQLQFNVLAADSAEAALDLLRQELPDLILMDMQLPGMDGLSCVRLLKQDPRTSGVPVIAVSAHAMRHSIDQAYAEGCVDYITKPITDDPFTFLERVTRPLRPGPEPVDPAGLTTRS